MHRPEWVQMQDPTIRHWFRDFHHHEQGVCDLDVETQHTVLYGQRKCRRQIWSQAPNLCGCYLCTAAVARRLKRKKERVAWRNACRDLLKTQAVDRWDMDVPPPSRADAW